MSVSKSILLLAIVVSRLMIGPHPAAQSGEKMPIPAPEGKAMQFNIARGVGSSLVCLGLSDTLIFAGAMEDMHRHLLYFCTVGDDGPSPLMVVLDTTIRSSSLWYLTEERFSPALAQDTAGHVAVAWAKQRGHWDDVVYPQIFDKPVVRCALIQDGIPLRVLEIDGGDHPSVRFDANGDLHLVCEKVSFYPYHPLGMSSYYDTTYFFVTSRLVYYIVHSDGTKDSILTIPRGFRPQLAIDNAGNRHLFWLEADSSNSAMFSLHYARDPGSPGARTSIISTEVRGRDGSSINGRPPSFASFVDDSGRVYAGWADIEEYDNGKIFLARSNSGVEWTTSMLAGSPLHRSPVSFLVTRSGRAHVTWGEYVESSNPWILHYAHGGPHDPMFTDIVTIPAATGYPGDVVLVNDSRDSTSIVFNDGRGEIRYCRDPASGSDSSTSLGSGTLVQYGIRGLPDGGTPGAGVALDRTGQLWLVATDGDLSLLRVDRGVVSVGAGKDQLPPGPVLAQNYPNPFNPSTTIRYDLSVRSHVMLAVFNMLGQQVAVLQDGEQETGHHAVRFDAQKLPSGVYFYRLQMGGWTDTMRCLLLR